jgi:hypothetical protein
MVRSRERGGVGVTMSSKLDTRTAKGPTLPVYMYIYIILQIRGH